MDWTRVSTAGVEFLKSYEGFVGYPHDDKDGKKAKTRVTAWPKDIEITIGYGHVIGSEEGWESFQDENGAINITDEKAEEFLEEDLMKDIKNVRARVGVPLSQAEFDALSILAFNIGGNNFPGSSIVRLLDNDTGTMPDYDSLEESMKWWRLDKKKVSRGLMRRRAEAWGIVSHGVYKNMDEIF